LEQPGDVQLPDASSPAERPALCRGVRRLCRRSPPAPSPSGAPARASAGGSRWPRATIGRPA